MVNTIKSKWFSISGEIWAGTGEMGARERKTFSAPRMQIHPHQIGLSWLETYLLVPFHQKINRSSAELNSVANKGDLVRDQWWEIGRGSLSQDLGG
jgi:hypothetical protein